VFPKEARERAYTVSPAARELWPALDGPPSDGWRRFGCDQISKDTCDEILAPWFVWAFRDAVHGAGHYRSARDAFAYYQRLADEINGACDTGRIPCLPERATLAPPFRWQDVRDALALAPQFYDLLLRSGDGAIASLQSDGSPAGLAAISRMVGPISPLEGHPRRLLIASAIARNTVAIMPWAATIAAIGFVLALLFPAIWREYAGLLILTFACGIAVASRILLLAYIQATSFPAMGYVFAVSPLLITCVVLGLYCGGLAVAQFVRIGMDRRYAISP
jgi:hypothetical protein